MKIYTLEELGANLPIGSLSGGKLEKSFEIRPFKTKIDRHLATWVRNNQGKHSELILEACKVPKLLSMLCSSKGKQAFTVTDKGDSTAEAEANIYKWHYGDVLYMWLYARVQSVGKMLTYPVACPNAGCTYSVHDALFDLSQTEINVLEDPSELYQWVKLRDPFVLRDNKTILKSVKLGPVAWSTFTKPGVLDSEVGAFDVTSLRDSICAINENDQQKYNMLDSEIDEFSKFDFVTINQKASETSAGPSMQTTIKCPLCNFPITNLLQWTYESFFEDSLPVGISI